MNNHRLSDFLIEPEPQFASMPVVSTMREAAAVMAHGGHTVVAVFNENKLEGLLTRGDMLRYFVKAGEGTDQVISRVINRSLVAAGPETSFASALQLMEQNDIEHLPVIDQGKMVGLVNKQQLLRRMVDVLQFDYGQMQEYIDHLHQAGQD